MCSSATAALQDAIATAPVCVFEPITEREGRVVRRITQLLITGLAAGLTVFVGSRMTFSGYAEEPAPCPAPVRFMGYHSYLRDLTTLKEFGALGIDVVTFFPANTLSSVGVPYSPYPPIWIGPGMHRLDCVDQQIHDILEANPRAKIILEIDLNTPVWWPRWLGAAADRDDSFTKLGKVAAHPGWRQDTREYLQTLLKHLEANYSERIIAYVLVGGMTLEWQDMARGEESAVRRKAWRDWMIAQGLPDPVDIPPASVREHVTHGLFRDPVADRQSILYWKFNADLIADTILFYAKAAQEVIRHRVPVGVYYGYWLEHAAGRLLYEGHLGFEKVLNSPDVDFFLAPGSYFDRQIGGASGFMVCLASIRHHRKGFVHEIDHRTHTAKSVTLLGRPVPGHESGFPDEQSTIAGLRREFALGLINGTALWWFDMFGHWYDGAAVRQALAEMASLWQRFSPIQTRSVSEVAVFVDSESFYYLDGHASIYNDLLSRQRFGLARMGAPYDIYVFSDLATVDLSQYKMVIFPNLFVVDDEKINLLSEKVFKDHRTVVWIHSPGIIWNGRCDPDGVEKLTGLPVGAQEITVKDFSTWRSVLAPKSNLSGATLREIAQKAGVHIYCEEDQVCYVNSHFIAFHTARPGEWQLRLREPCSRVMELFSGQEVGHNVQQITCRADGPNTFLYLLEK